MRYLISFFLLFTLVNCKKKENANFIKADFIPTKIDSLNSKNEVQKFVNELTHPFYEQKISEDSVIIYRKFKEFELKKISDFKRDCRFDKDSLTKKIADSLKINKSFYKSDFDNNGLTDLLIIGDAQNCMGMAGCDDGKYISCGFSVYALMNFKTDSINSIDLNFITKNLSLVPKIIKSQNGSFIELHKPIDYKIKNGTLKKFSRTIPVTYKYGTFIERNENKKEYDIENIEFIAEGCVSGCPEFMISIDQNKNGILNAINYNWFDKDFSFNLEPNDIDGEYKTQISDKNFKEIYGIMNYLDFTNLDNVYSSGATHSNSVTLKITYNNGKIKTLKDYGLIGTYGLKRVYELFYELRFNQNWKKQTTAHNL